MPEPQRILFLGHTGIGKTLAVRNLSARYLEVAHQLPTGLDHVDAAKWLRVACLEDFIPDTHGFLDLTNETAARQQWDAALAQALEGLRQGPPTAHLFLSLHGSYYRRARAFSRADLGALADFAPTQVVTLIDDVYDVSRTIADRDTQDALRLREIATWRSIEGMIADFIARPLKIPSYTLALKHPADVATALLFTDRTRVYSAFPISRTRPDAQRRAEIEAFKARLQQEGLVILDPSTIDEMLLEAELDAADANAEEITLGASGLPRWESAPGPLLTEGRPEPTHPPTFSRLEIEEATQDIQKQVESRDFRLIHDADCVVAYRPNWGGTPSRGVTAELHLAQGIGRRIFILSLPEDEEGTSSPFGEFGNVYADVGELVAAAKQVQRVARYPNVYSNLHIWREGSEMARTMTLWLQSTNDGLIEFLEARKLHFRVEYVGETSRRHQQFPVFFTPFGTFEGERSIRRAAAVIA